MSHTNIDVTLLSEAEMYDLIVEVVGDETSLEFCTLTSHYIDGNDIDTAMRANGTQWSNIKPLMEEIEEKAGERREEKRDSPEYRDDEGQPVPEGDSGPLPIQYSDLEWEADQLFDRMAERLAEKAEENGGAGWRDCEPEYLSELAEEQLLDFGEAVRDGDLDEAREQAADTVNFVLMTLATISMEGSS